jgi:hypothetical protein
MDYLMKIVLPLAFVVLDVPDYCPPPVQHSHDASSCSTLEVVVLGLVVMQLCRHHPFQGLKIRRGAIQQSKKEVAHLLHEVHLLLV